ncbi:MAG: hydrolase [Wenzhouxiangellaceae bacterium]
MNRLTMAVLAASLLVPSALITAARAESAAAPDNQPATIKEWLVPWPDSRPRDPYRAPDGSVWLVGQGDDYAARFNPDDESFQRFDLPPGTGPHNIIVAADGAPWYAGNRNAHIGRLNPETGEITRFPTPEDQLKDPHTLIFADSGMLWFTSQWANHIGRLNPQNGAVEAVAVPTQKARPYGIVLDSDGQPWIALLGTNKLATVDPATMSLTEIELPRADARPRRLAVTSDDMIWYVDYQQGYLGCYDPDSGDFREWRAPGKDRSGPYAMAADNQGRLWFFETWQQPNRLVGFDPRTESFFSLSDVPSGGGTVRHMVFDPRDNALWFGTDTNYLGKALLP